MKRWQVLRTVFPEVITDNFCHPKTNKKAPIPLGIRAFPNLAFQVAVRTGLTFSKLAFNIQ